MKKYILHIALFFAIVAVADFTIGKFGDFLSSHARGGIVKEVRQSAKEQEADIVVMGSSRAHHHYVPSVLNDTLNMTAHNAGVDGNGIVLATGLYHLMTKRYQPKVIIYDVTPNFDIYQFAEDGNDTRYLGYLRPYFTDSDVKNVLTRIDPLERFKNYSSMFRYNSKIVALLKDQIVKGNFRNDGYSPLFGEMKERIVMDSEEISPVDSLKYQMMKEFLENAKRDNIHMVLTISPCLGATTSEDFAPVQDICSRCGVELWDYYYDTLFQRPSFFNDRMHLNDKGAQVYTSVIASRLKAVLN